ncbi:MAG: hydrolase 2, exosortase A system-associated [Pseudomonadota bacterium]
MSKPSAEPFFLDARPGQRFCLFHAPHAGTQSRGSIIYVHPFGEEMNRSRRMAALQARAFAAAGFGVLQIDLFGCGDSSGEFGDARWELWKEDLALAWKWLDERAAGPISLWGLRLGALLALDFARDALHAVDRLILWQPVVSGNAFLTQFLRTRVASDMLAGKEGTSNGTQGMRDVLNAGATLDIAGYELAPPLAARIDGLAITGLLVANTPVHWFEVVAEPDRPLPPAIVRASADWQRLGVDCHVHRIAGAPFWATQEITEAPALLTATIGVFTEVVS